MQVPDSCLSAFPIPRSPIPRSLSQQPLRLKLLPVHLDHVVSTSESHSQERRLLQEVLRGEVVLLGGGLQGSDPCVLQIPPCLLPASNIVYKKPADRSPMLPRPLQINKSCELNPPGFAEASDWLATFLLKFQEPVVLDPSPVSLGSRWQFAVAQRLMAAELRTDAEPQLRCDMTRKQCVWRSDRNLS